MINIQTLADLIDDLRDICDAIDDDPDAPTATRDRITYALDMIRDDAHDIEPDDPTYPYALTELQLDELASILKP